MAIVHRAPHAGKLTRAAEFIAVLAGSHRSSSRSFILRAQPNTLAGARLGLVASRKAARRAVDRNRGKRLVREAFRAIGCNLPAVDIVVQLRNDLRKLGNAALRAELERLLAEVLARRRALAGATKPI